MITDLAQVDRRLNNERRLEAVETMLARSVPDIVYAMADKLAVELNVPLAAVTVLDSTHQHYLATSAGTQQKCEVGGSKCQFVIATGNELAINNVREDRFFSRLKQFWITPEDELLAYLGVPLTDADGEIVGAVCVVDSNPREWTAQEHYLVHEASQQIREALIA